MFVPKRRSNKKQKPWLNLDLRKISRKKYSAWQTYMTSGWSTEKEAIYRRINKECQFAIKEAVRRYENNLAMNAKKNPKLVYNYINGKMTVNNSIKALNITSSNSITTDATEIANYLNDYFKSVFNKDVNSNFPEFFYKTTKVCDPDPVEMFSINKITNTLANLDPNKSMGPDLINSLVLKSCAKAFSLPIPLIFHESFVTGTVPTI